MQREVSIIEAIKMGFQKYAQFGGRSSRSEYWWWYLFTYIVSHIVTYVLIILLVIFIGFKSIPGLITIGALFLLELVLLLIPTLAISCRRMHDIGKGGGWIFINLLPIAGPIWFIILCCEPSEPFPNRFGDIPNEA